MNSQQESNFFKQKRDEYLVEIRKKKISDQLQAKRIKIALASDQAQNADTITQSIPELASSFTTLYKAGTLEGLFQIAQSIRKAISVDDNPPIAELIETGVMPYIMDLLKTDNNQSIELVVECLWIAANVTSGKAESVKYLVDLDLIPIAFQLLEHQNPDIKENVIWILANLAGDSKVYRSALLKKGLASKIDALLTDNSLGKPIISGTVWLMSNLCRSKPYPEFGEVASFLSYIEYFLKNSQDEELIEHCMAILCAFTDTDDEEQIQEVVDTDVYNELFAMIREGNSKIRGYAVKTIGNIISHTDEHTEGLVEKGLVGLLLPVLDDQVKLIKKNACWTYANILACTPSQVDKVFEFESGKIVKKLFQMTLSEDKEIARECVYALSNSCDTGSVQEIDCLVSEGFIEMMVEIFINSNDKDLIQACLTALSTILSEGAVMGDSIEDNPYYIRLQQCDGIAVLEKLQNFASDEMFRVIEEILDEFSGKN